MSAIYDIAINLLANAIWAIGGFVIAKLLLKKSNSRMRGNNKKLHQTVPDYPPFNQGSYKMDTRVSLLDYYDIDIALKKIHNVLLKVTGTFI